MWKLGKLLLRSNFSFLSTMFSIYFYLQESIYISFFNIFIFAMCLFDLFFLKFANLICRGTDISKYLTASTGLLENESRLCSSTHILENNVQVNMPTRALCAFYLVKSTFYYGIATILHRLKIVLAFRLTLRRCSYSHRGLRSVCRGSNMFISVPNVNRTYVCSFQLHHNQM